MFGKSVFVGYVPYDKCVISMIYCLISLAKTYYSQWDYYNWLVSIAALQYKYHCYFLSMVQKMDHNFISGGDEEMVGDEILKESRNYQAQVFYHISRWKCWDKKNKINKN